MENLNESLKQAVCIEEEVFFGPIADKERKIREQFENAIINENRMAESHLAVENDISRNDSLYKSFSVDESKYDSFEDSLNEDKWPQETKRVSLRKGLDKLKAKRHGFYDSLEDVCSLVSNMDKCSISCDVENSSNFNNKQHIIEDSLKNQPVAVTNKSNGVSEQVQFDDDSLAILELENTFDDSLEEINDVCIEIEELDDIENMATESQNVAIKVEQSPVCFPRNLFDSSVQVVYEKMWASDQEESSDDKNIFYDSISHSDFKDILKDSLEESEKCNENLNFLKMTGGTDVNVKKSEGVFASQNSFNSSGYIIFQDFPPTCHIDNSSEKTNSEYYEFSKDSLENCKNIDVDPMEQTNTDTGKEGDLHLCNKIVVLSNENTLESKEHSKNCATDAIDSVLYSASNATKNSSIVKDTPVIAELAASVSAVIDDSDNVLYSASIANNKKDKILKDTLVVVEPMIPSSSITDVSNNVVCSESTDNQYYKIMKDTSVNTSIITEPVIPDSDTISVSGNRLCSDSNANRNCKVMKDTSMNTSIITEPVISASVIDARDNMLHSDSNDNQNYKIMKDASVNTSIITEPVIPASANNNLGHKETFSEDSCHLKLLSDDVNIDKDLKFQRHLELTVGDKKCQLAPQEVSVVPPMGGHSRKCENEPLTCVSAEDHASQERDVVDSSISKLNANAEECNVVREDLVYNKVVSHENFCEKSMSNVTCRAKSSRSHMVIDSEEKTNFPESLSNISLLQALDLHDISSFLNESIVQSNDSLLPLNLCCRDQNIYTQIFREESKENVPQMLTKRKTSCVSSKKASPNKVNIGRIPTHFQKSPSLKDSTKKPGTKIPVRKIEYFPIPTVTPCKAEKQNPTVQSAEKANRYQPSPHSAGKKTAATTNKTPHFCKVRNTIFSKVPQIVPSKKYMNIQSPVAQYIKNVHGSEKTPHFDPVLRDCMNQPLESPYHAHHTPKSGTLKMAKKKSLVLFQ